MNNSWPFNPGNFVYMGAGGYVYLGSPEDMEDTVDNLPEIPPEVHNTRPINPQACMDATRALSKGQ